MKRTLDIKDKNTLTGVGVGVGVGGVLLTTCGHT